MYLKISSRTSDTKKIRDKKSSIYDDMKYHEK